MRKANLLTVGLWIFFIGGIVTNQIGLPESIETMLIQLTLLALSLVSLLELGRSDHRAAVFAWSFVSTILTLIIEIVGVKTGYPFGSYYYTSRLGVSISGVPILISLAWLTSLTCANAWSTWLTKNPLHQLIVTALLIVLFDLVLEPAAFKLNLWRFDGPPPFQNYLSWSIVAVFLSAPVLFRAPEVFNRPILRHIFLAQIAYFLAI